MAERLSVSASEAHQIRKQAFYLYIKFDYNIFISVFLISSAVCSVASVDYIV